MASFRDRVNAHLPIVLQFLSTASLIVIALGAICGSQSLKKMAESHEPNFSSNSNQGHIHGIKNHKHR